MRRAVVRRRRYLAIAAAILLGLSTLWAVSGEEHASALGSPTPHLAIIMMENKELSSIVGDPNAPYINDTLIPSGRLFTSYYAAAHPSLPNYLMLTSGTFGGCVVDTCPPGSATQDNLFAQMDRSTPAISWRVYAEGMPSNCYAGNTRTYARRHNPPVYYGNLSTCATNDVPYTALSHDLSNGTLPQFAMIIPNLYHDMHTNQKASSCMVGSARENEICQGDAWLSSSVPALLAEGDVTVLLAFDEGTTDQGGGGNVLLLEIGPQTCGGCTETTPSSERSVPDAVDDWFDLPHLVIPPPSF